MNRKEGSAIPFRTEKMSTSRGRRQQPRKVIEEKFKDQLLHKLDELRKASNLCDITLRAGG